MAGSSASSSATKGTMGSSSDEDGTSGNLARPPLNKKEKEGERQFKTMEEEEEETREEDCKKLKELQERKAKLDRLEEEGRDITELELEYNADALNFVKKGMLVFPLEYARTRPMEAAPRHHRKRSFLMRAEIP